MELILNMIGHSKEKILKLKNDRKIELRRNERNWVHHERNPLYLHHDYYDEQATQKQMDWIDEQIDKEEKHLRDLKIDYLFELEVSKNTPIQI